MKKVTVFITGCTFVLLLVSPGKSQERQYPPEISPAVYDIYDLVVRDNSLRFIPDDPEDYWQSPAETEARGGGDSEDLAIWVYKKLYDMGYQVNFMTCRIMTWGRDDFHAWVRFNTYALLGGVVEVWDIDLTTKDKIFPARVGFNPPEKFREKFIAALERNK